MRVHRSTQPITRHVQPSQAKAPAARTAAPQDVFAPAPAPRSLTSRPTVSRGSQGEAVAQLQRLLAQHGFNPGAADGDFGARTEAALCAFQRQAGLDADGVCGPMTWASLSESVFEQPQVTTTTPAGETGLTQRILDLAQAEVGTVEATGSNDGDVLKYPNFFGRGSEPYCADFVSWVFTQAGKPLDFSYVPSLREHLEETGQWKGQSDPQPGDIVIFNFDGAGDGDHVGIVKSVNEDGSIVTIEGNTGQDDALSDSNTGESGVWNRLRTMDQILGFASP
ncbi:MAG: peptidoglycan-binding protein [Myxococcales bacterium]